MQRTLDRIPHTDPRNWPARMLTARPPRNCSWRAGIVLDQGGEGACVGFGWTAELGATPKIIPISDAEALYNYRLAVAIDRAEGRYYRSGATVLAGAKAMRSAGYIREFRWGDGLYDTLSALSWSGPVVLGIDWHESMYEAPDGLVTVSGAIAGGHCILATGVSVRHKTVTLRNSWGPDWGNGGSAKIAWADLQMLLAAGGEACVPVGRSTGPVKQTSLSRLGLAA